MTAVLTIDRSPFVRGMVQRFLLPYEVQTEQAVSAQGGVEIARQRKPDLVVFGFDGSDESDRSALAALRQDPLTRDIPIVAVVAEASKALVEIVDLGVTSFIVKPFTREGFDRVIGRMLASPTAPPRPVGEIAPQRTSVLAENDGRGTLARLSPTGELPAFSGAVTTALNIARDPDAELEALCNAIQRDVGLSARVLRIANSASFARRTASRSLRDAVTTIGMKTIHDVLSATALRSLADPRNPALDRLWSHSLAVALASEEILAVTGVARRGSGFLPGLFHDAGRIVLALTDTAGYEELERLQVPPGEDLRAIEHSWYGFDHARIGTTLSAEWGLPSSLCEAIEWHHTPENASPRATVIAAVIAAADQLSYEVGLGATPNTAVQGADFPILTPDQKSECLERFKAVWSSEQASFS